MAFFEAVYDRIYFVGIQTLRYGKRFFRWLLSLLLKPIRTLGTLVFTLIIVINKHALGAFHKSVDDFKKLLSDAKGVRDAKKTDEEKGKRKFSHYVKVATRRYKSAFLYFLNYALPVLCFLILFNVVVFWTDVNFALEINYNDEVIGYVQNEAVYKEAKQMADERLNIRTDTISAVENGNQGNGSDTTEYKIVPVKRSKMNNAYEICDKIMEKSNEEITNACGIYIDGEFICALKNETDAINVFDQILSEHETGESNAVVSFVENIDYVQGLYPDNEKIIRDSAYLQEKLKSNRSEAKYYTIQEGDTVSQIAERFGTDSSTIFALNPELRENIYIGQVILVQKEVKFIEIQTTKTVIEEVEIPYETIKINTNTLYVGDTRVVSKGQKGLEQVTKLVTYVDGEVTSTKEVSRVILKESISEKIHVGTKKNNAVSGNVTSYGGRFVWPAIGAYQISSGYGYRNFGDGWHGGIDIVRPGGSTGCTVVAAESGTVTFAGWKNSAGYTVIIDHGGGLKTHYYHMKAGSLRVSTGQKVQQGQAIGQIGATGYVTGAHLHFEVKVNGKDVNPKPYLGI